MEVRILSGKNPDPDGPQPDFVLKDLTIPLFDPLIRAQGYQFAKIDWKVIKEAVGWADIIHLEEPFLVQTAAARIAGKMHKPCVGTYHLHPENMYASVGLERSKLFNIPLLISWRDFIFNHCSDIQCPTENVKERLARFGFKARLHVISNGMIQASDKTRVEKKPNEDGTFNVICVGRLSREKDQGTLLEAMKYCKNAGKIRLYFAGRGPEEENYKRKAESLVEQGILHYPPVFTFLDKRGLEELALRADLYIHCATIEVEGLSCLEVLQKQVVPVIAEGDLSATSQFALDARSCFPSRDPKSLAKRIDYWLEHGRERREMELEYAELAEGYDIRKSISELIDMYKLAISTDSPSQDR